jgi:acyl-coenzyme A synthetase/AMP-(fatty) acid ligase
MVGAYHTTGLVFDLCEEDIYWCTADVGWVTGHTYVVYGAFNGATSVVYGARSTTDSIASGSSRSTRSPSSTPRRQ